MRKRSYRRAEITVETEELRLPGTVIPGVQVRCPFCAGQVFLITPETAARLAAVSPRAIYRWVESGKLHFTETADRSLLICPDSLRAAVGQAFLSKILTRGGGEGPVHPPEGRKP